MIEEMFHDILKPRFEDLGLSEEAHAYVTFTMREFIKKPVGQDALCITILDTSDDGSGGWGRLVSLTDVGNEALVGSGFFGWEEMKYYEFIGRSAFGELSAKAPIKARSLYAELSDRFGALQESLRWAKDACRYWHPGKVKCLGE